jgi:hypothetical protein
MITERNGRRSGALVRELGDNLPTERFQTWWTCPPGAFRAALKRTNHKGTKVTKKRRSPGIQFTIIGAALIKDS